MIVIQLVFSRSWSSGDMISNMQRKIEKNTQTRPI